MRRVRLSLLSLIYVLAVFVAPLVIGQTVFASGDTNTNIISKPALVTASTTATFVSRNDAFGPMECKLDDGDIQLCGIYQSVTYTSLSEGEHTFTVHAAAAENPESTATYTWTVARPPELTGSTTFNSSPGESIAVTDLQIDDSGDEIRTVQLHVAQGTLQMSTTTGLSFSGPESGATLLFMGTRNDLNNALATLTYTPTAVGTVTLHASIGGEEGQEDSIIDNRAFRVLHSDTGLTWAEAANVAEATSLGGYAGHLAAITSAEVNDFVNQRTTGGVWIGGSDASNEGEWKWVGGAHDGEVFWNGDASGSAPSGMYAHWIGTMPDNYNGNENCLETGHSDTTPTWNDQVCSDPHNDYVVEYGDGIVVPDVSTKDISLVSSVDTDNDGISNAEENAGPNNGDANNDGTPDAQQIKVASFVNPVTNHYQVITTDCDDLSAIQTGSEAADPHNDKAYDYPMGLTSFRSLCGGPGQIGTFTQYFYGVSGNDTLVLRKWSDDSYAPLPGFLLEGEPIGNEVVFKVTYQITEGGEFDEDGEANGYIVDPAGLGTPVVGAPNTGLGR